MLHCPKYSVGSLVHAEGFGTATGKIIGLEANLKVGRTGKYTYKVIYFVEFYGSEVRKVHESQILDVPQLTLQEQEMNKFLADSLLLSRNINQEKVDRTIRELLGGNNDG
ncbi:hypothetical protein [Microcystis phage MaeS]|nr:hypothetical protein [Microcystis phage MaeS]